jgi:hypothetical protein
VRAGGQAAQDEVSKLHQQQGQTTTFLEQQLQDLYLQKFDHDNQCFHVYTNFVTIARTRTTTI